MPTVVPLFRKAGLLEDERGLHMEPLSILLLSVIGPAYLQWDYEALRLELEERYGKIGNVTWERIMALPIPHLLNSPWVEWEVFEKISAVVNGEIAVFTYVQPPEPEEVACTIYFLSRVANHEYDEEVLSYIVAACLDDGLWYLKGTPMEIAQSELDEMDERLGIERDYWSVKQALEQNKGFYKNPETAAQVQANKVRDVQLVLNRYKAAVAKQLEGLRPLLQRK